MQVLRTSSCASQPHTKQRGHITQPQPNLRRGLHSARSAISNQGNDTQGGSNYNPTTAPLPAPPTPISTGPLASFLEAEREYRAQGTVVPEVVFGVGKSPDQIATMLTSICERQRLAIATRIEPDMYAAVRKLVQGVEYNARARLLTLHSPVADQLPKQERLPGTVAIVSGGSADLAIAEECRILAEHLGAFCFRLPDMGLGNGLTRLLGCIEALRAADVVVVVCGLDGALASVVAGLVEAPVVAVPTSVGYGAALGGIAPLLAQLACTTPGLTVTNIDNGLGGAMAATKMLRMANRLHKTRRQAEIAAAEAAAKASSTAKAVAN